MVEGVIVVDQRARTTQALHSLLRATMGGRECFGVSDDRRLQERMHRCFASDAMRSHIAHAVRR